MRALILFALLVTALSPALAQWPEVTIQDIQMVANPDSSDNSPFNADTVKVIGVVCDDARSLWIGARWSTMITAPEGGPWSGLQVIQNDTTVGGTNFSAVQPGFKVRFTGYIEEYPSGEGNSGTELMLLTNPLVPIEVLGIDALPEPEVLTCEDFATRSSGEQWEMVLVTIQNAIMINNDLSSDQALIQDDTGYQLTVEDWYNPLRDSLAAGLYSWPPNGSRFDITGHIRDLPNGAGYAIAPRSSGDIHLYALAPLIEDVERDIVVPGSADPVNITATIYDIDGIVETATLAYRVDGGTVAEVAMTPAGDSTFAGTIPAQPHNSVVEYFFKAVDDAQNHVMWPDTSVYLYLYHVLDEGFGIYHVQWTPYGDGVYTSDSPYSGYTVTVTGTVMNDTLPFAGSYYYIQSSGTDPWSGLWVHDSYTVPNPGDLVQVTGVVEEDYEVTRIVPQNPAVDVQTLSTGNPVYDPIVLPTGALNTDAGLGAEQWEGMLVRVEGCTVTNAFPDAPGNYGEFSVDDGSGEYRVDDLALTFDAQLDTLFPEGTRFDYLQGFQYYSFYNFKLIPRGDWDYQLGVGADRPGTPDVVRLLPPTPNPGSTTFTLTYALPQAGQVQLGIYDMAGREVQLLDLGAQSAGTHRVTWNGLDSRGRRLASGTYLCRVSTNGQERTERLVVLR